MDYGAFDTARLQEAQDMAEQRSAKRFTSLIRAAKLVSTQGEFVCVIRDVSATGISLRLFHDLPVDDRLALELQNGESYEIRKVREQDHDASFTFRKAVDVDRLIQESWNYPKRQLRLALAMPLTVVTIEGRFDAMTENISQQGCRLETQAPLAIDQSLRLEGDKIPDIRAKVRWRDGYHYGLVFDTTFTLRDFALTAAQLQSPGLIAQ